MTRRPSGAVRDVLESPRLPGKTGTEMVQVAVCDAADSMLSGPLDDYVSHTTSPTGRAAEICVAFDFDLFRERVATAAYKRLFHGSPSRVSPELELRA